MMITNVILILLLVAGFLYWLSASRGKEVARQVGRRACEAEGVQFLDDTVVLTRTRLRRGADDRPAIYREYRFEFSVEGDRRYHGEIALLGRILQRITLEPYRISPLH